MGVVEVCCYSVDDAIIAESAGADRINLCAGHHEGGLTPSYGMLIEAKKRITIPITPIVRPRGGDFCYNMSELKTMRSDIELIRDLGYCGVSIGLLDEDGRVEISKVKQLMAVAGKMEVSFHRAFDICQKPFDCLEVLTDLGIDRIMTSGQQYSAEMGLPMIKELAARSQGPIIEASGGIHLTNIDQFIKAGINYIHTLANKVQVSKMRYRKVGIRYSSEFEQDEFTRFNVDGDAVFAIKSALTLYHHAH